MLQKYNSPCRFTYPKEGENERERKKKNYTFAILKYCVQNVKDICHSIAFASFFFTLSLSSTSRLHFVLFFIRANAHTRVCFLFDFVLSLCTLPSIVCTLVSDAKRWKTETNDRPTNWNDRIILYDAQKFLKHSFWLLHTIFTHLLFLIELNRMHASWSDRFFNAVLNFKRA